MFKVKEIDNEEAEIQTVYAVTTDEMGRTMFLFYCDNGDWVWNCAEIFEPV
jgi:hypothetical protein